jgi:hypothetical protein
VADREAEAEVRETSRERSGSSEDVEEYTASVGAIATADERERGER